MIQFEASANRNLNTRIEAASVLIGALFASAVFAAALLWVLR